MPESETAWVAPTADVVSIELLGPRSRVWDLAQIRDRATLGRNVIVGRGAYVGVGVHIGHNCKIQNFALVYEPALIEDGVFIGPAAVLTNDQYPRAVNPDGSQKSTKDWQPVGVTVRTGASVGARAVCVAPVTVGAWAMVAAGAVVVRDVPEFALVAGVPARRVGWVGRVGQPLVKIGDGMWRCPQTGDLYQQTESNRLEAL